MDWNLCSCLPVWDWRQIRTHSFQFQGISVIPKTMQQRNMSLHFLFKSNTSTPSKQSLFLCTIRKNSAYRLTILRLGSLLNILKILKIFLKFSYGERTFLLHKWKDHLKLKVQIWANIPATNKCENLFTIKLVINRKLLHVCVLEESLQWHREWRSACRQLSIWHVARWTGEQT